MKSRQPEHRPSSVYLMPGELYVSEAPAIVSTVLGSCVAVTMFSPSRRIGAICHGLLPVCRGGQGCNCDALCLDSMRYVECSMWKMVEALKAKQIAATELEVKMFGGAEMFGTSGQEARAATVGRQNIDKALEIIEGIGLRLVASDVGGFRGRKIFFNTSTGEVLLKRLTKRSLLVGHE